MASYNSRMGRDRHSGAVTCCIVVRGIANYLVNIAAYFVIPDDIARLSQWCHDLLKSGDWCYKF